MLKIILLILMFCPLVFFSQVKIDTLKTYTLEEKISKPVSDMERYKCIKATGAFKGHGLFSILKSKIAFYKASKRARKYSKELFPNQGATNTKKDAFRHAIWSALLARYFTSISSKKHRLAFSKAVGNANEFCGSNAKDGLEMDYHNNKVGRYLFEKNTTYRKFLHITIGLKKPKTSELKKMIFELVKKAQFVDKNQGANKTANIVKSLDSNKVVFIKK